MRAKTQASRISDLVQFSWCEQPPALAGLSIAQSAILAVIIGRQFQGSKMKIIHSVAVGALVTMLITPAHAQDAESTSIDPAIDCGAFFVVMAEQADTPDDARMFKSMSDLLLNDVDKRLVYLGASLEERERIGGDAVTRVSQKLESGDIGLTFADCHVSMERAIETAMSEAFTPKARELLTCGSQFLYTLQSGEADEQTNSDLEVASTDQLQRAGVNMQEAGITAEERDQISELYGLSIGMVLGMGEEPIIAWEQCGEA